MATHKRIWRAALTRGAHWDAPGNPTAEIVVRVVLEREPDRIVHLSMNVADARYLHKTLTQALATLDPQES